MRTKLLIHILLSGLLCVILFHLLVIAGIIPSAVVWAGSVKNDAQLIVLEATSVAVNVFLSYLLLMKAGYAKRRLSEKVMTLILWFFFVIFLLNTAGNLLANTAVEKSLAVVTFVFATLIFLILRRSKLDNSVVS